MILINPTIEYPAGTTFGLLPLLGMEKNRSPVFSYILRGTKKTDFYLETDLTEFWD